MVNQINLITSSLVPLVFILEYLTKVAQTVMEAIRLIFTQDFSSFRRNFKEIWKDWSSWDFASSTFENLF